MKSFGIFFDLIRYKQWIKNLIIFFPIFFAGELFDFNKLILTIIAFVLLCLTTGFGYIFNDIIDVEKDRLHPVKRKRPIASYAVNKKNALLFGLFLFSAAFLISLLINIKLSFVLFLYILNVVLYSLFFKRIAYVDIFFIAFAFELRLFAGGFAAGVYVSKWLLILTFSVAMMLACGKRIKEISLVNIAFRSSLKFYNKTFLEVGFIVFSAISLSLFFAYLSTKHIYNILLYAVSFILVANYAYNALKKNFGEPTEFMLKNKLNFAMLAFWAFLFFKEIYL